MTGQDTYRQRLKDAGERRLAAKRAVEEATVDLADWAIRARDAGIPMTEIAELACLSRKAVYDLIAWRRGERPNRS